MVGRVTGCFARVTRLRQRAFARCSPCRPFAEPRIDNPVGAVSHKV
jgi:hypothetical protein